MTVRLAALAVEHWADLDGWAMSKNLPDLREMPLDRFANLVWYWATRKSTEPRDVERFRARLWIPPKGTEVTKGPWSPEAETKAFASLKAALNQK